MEWLFLFMLIAVGWIAAKSRKKETRETPIKFTVETSYCSDHSGSDKNVDTGDVNEVSPGTFEINPKSPLPITLSNCSSTHANTVKKLLEGEANWERNISELSHIIAQKNIEFPGLEKTISEMKYEVKSSIETQKNNSAEWNEASEKDKDDLLKEFQSNAIDQLPIKPSSEYVLDTLLFCPPKEVTADDKLLSSFSGNTELYRFYVSCLGSSSKAVQVPTDDYNRKNWESLVKLGLSKRGKEIAVEMLLDGLRLKDINEYFSDRLNKKLTRKAKAIDFALSQPDVLDVLSKHMSFREMFQVVEPEGVDISDVKACYQYATAQANIIRDTYVTGYRTLATLLDAKDAEYDGWEIEPDDCCAECEKRNGKITKRKPSKLPPFHFGCTCSLEGVYE
jgi:hypothetical protein